MERTGLPMFISVDEEGGTVTRISGKNFDVPYIGDMADLGSRGDPEEARGNRPRYGGLSAGSGI